MTNVPSGQDSITSAQWSICPTCGPNSLIFLMSVFCDMGLHDMWTEIFASLLEKWKPSPGSPQVPFPQAQRHEELSAKEFPDVKALFFLYFLSLTSGCACKWQKDINCFDSAPSLLLYWWKRLTSRGKLGYSRSLACAMLNKQLSSTSVSATWNMKEVQLSTSWNQPEGVRTSES